MAILHKEHSAIVAGDPDDVLQRVAVAVARVPRYTIAPGGAGTLVLTRRHYAAWRIIVAIVLFPVGLIALFWRDTETVVVTATEHSPGRTRLTSAGVFTNKLIDALNSVVEPEP